ncbi:transposase family protein [Nostoc sp.]|uniref:transposase family protein n=1 Tax=Nostoc sp. TaxID=1180 RepID=UPI002FF4AD27
MDRPSDYEKQKKYYSGKKKMHTLKNQIIVLPNGEDIVDVTIGKLGKTSVINLFRETHHKFSPRQKFLGDKAYKGEETITTAHKKTKKTEITELQKIQNKELSSRRIAVEHLICRLKTFRIASERFGLNRNKYSQVIKTICGLVRLRLNRLVLFT